MAQTVSKGSKGTEQLEKQPMTQNSAPESGKHSKQDLRSNHYSLNAIALAYSEFDGKQPAKIISDREAESRLQDEVSNEMQNRYDEDFDAYNKIYTIDKSTFNRDFEFNGNFRLFAPRDEYRIRYCDHQFIRKKNGRYAIKHNPNVDKILLDIPKLSADKTVEKNLPKNDNKLGSIFGGPQNMPKVPTAINGKSTIQQNAEPTLSKRSLLPSNRANSVANIPNIFDKNPRNEETKSSNSIISRIKRSEVHKNNNADNSKLIERLSSISLYKSTLISNPSHKLDTDLYSVSHIYEGKRYDDSFMTQISKQKSYNQNSNLIHKRAQTTKPKNCNNDKSDMNNLRYTSK